LEVWVQGRRTSKLHKKIETSRVMESLPATKRIGTSAKGANRRVGRGKKSSLDSSEVTKFDKKAKSSESNSRQSEATSNAFLPTLAGTNKFFNDQKLGFRGGVKRKVQEAVINGENLQVYTGDYESFCEFNQQNDPNVVFLNQIASQVEGSIVRNIWKLLSDNNVLIYGVGDKDVYVQNMVQTYLVGEDVLELNQTRLCNSADSASISGESFVKALLAYISKHILKYKDLSLVAYHLVHQTQLIAGV
jgi:hypothetical protein